MAAEALATVPDRELVEKFLTSHDEIAFQAMLQRHGPMVFRVCRRALAREQDVEDAFQATFLILAREARTIRKQEALASWLHGVAYRAALKARTRAARRRESTVQREEADRQATLPDEVSWKELRAILDEELERLPERLRAPLVLCYLEGRTQDEAADQLGWSKSTCRRNLERGRELLGSRLARRGVALSAALFAPFLSEQAAATVPAALTQATLGAALRYGMGKAAADCAVSGGVIALLQGAAKPMLLSKLKVVLVLFIIAGLAAGAGVLAKRPAEAAQLPGAQPPGSLPDPKPAGPASKEAVRSITVRGKVLDPDGKPFAGAKLYLAHYGPRDEVRFSVRATSGSDGRFDFTIDRAELAKARPDQPDAVVKAWAEKPWVGQVAAVADGFGYDYVHVNGSDPLVELTLRLVKDVPVNGRILDPDGKPVAGAKLRVLMVRAFAGEDLGGVLQELRTNNVIADPVARTRFWVGFLPGQPEVVTTGVDGRFRASGFGRERVVWFVAEGPAIASIPFNVMTRVGETIVGPGQDTPPIPQMRRPGLRILPATLYAATFSHVAQASRTIRGVVRDKETGKPMAGLRLAVEAPIGPVAPAMHGRATGRTDAEGRYELLGMPKSEKYIIHVVSETGSHFSVKAAFGDAPGVGPLTADIQVLRGVVQVRGRVTDQATGKPVPGARVRYYPLSTNAEAFKLYRDYREFASAATAGPDGSFSLAALPGSGVVGAIAPAAHAYQRAFITPSELEAFSKKFKEPPSYAGKLLTVHGGSNILVQRDFHALSLIHPEEKDKVVTCELVLHP
jgi:RNA polymerase sigma factor (sigma-70 family)